ncbi:MAG TPA: hypothetical protein IAB07_03545 [Candidatus Caccalectryoclostridium excrementigallinarum]|uniref:Uncharacterized protein n=1 Tax=Candidatus Caccalectryoclostridium excrementigallinarum TaxID=2840710 RepID=A0A9D1SKC8_9FIRM|nr:hypothetical protein [Candidatus Caccalectryoclostridium excrementigallinarum]
MAEKLQTFSASRFFSCRKTTPPFENDLADRAHNCALRRNSVSPQDRFLEAWFSLFLRENIKVSRSPYPQKFTLSALIRSRCLLIRKMHTAHFRGNGVENIDFQRLYRTF